MSELSFGMRHIWQVAQAEARLGRHEAVKPGHLLIALLRGVELASPVEAHQEVEAALAVVEGMGIDHKRVISQVARGLGWGSGSPPGRLPASADTEALLSAGEAIAKRRGSDVIRPVDLLEALVEAREPWLVEVVGELPPAPEPLFPVRPREVADVEDAVPLEWKEGDVILDLYEVKGLLGEGGMGKVYRVHHRGWKIDLAVKSPKRESLRRAGGVEDFISEAEAWVELGLHPHIVTCHYVRTLGGIPRVFAEFVEGGSLKDWIAQGRLRDLATMLDVAIQFAWGVHYAHEQGLVHQDIKPANVMMTPDGIAKVTDFGLAKARPETEMEMPDERGGTVLVKGKGMTPGYCSPEQAGGQFLTRRTDIWSWGVSILEMFVGEVTWMSGVVAPKVLEMYLKEGPAVEGLPAMPEGLAELLRECFRWEPEGRPRDMLEVEERLEEIYWQEVGREYPRQMPEAVELRADSLNNRALSLLDLGREEEAEAAWEEALEADPHHAEATYNLGLWRWRKAQITDQDLVHQLEAVIATQFNAWWPRYLLGLVHLERGDGQAAEAALREATRIGGNIQEIREAMLLVSKAQAACCLHTFSGHEEHIWSVALTPDGRYAITGSADNTVRVWELSAGKCTHTLTDHKETIFAVTATPDSRYVFSGGEDKTIRQWELATGKCVNVFKAHRKGWVYSLAITPDGRWLVSGGAGGDTTLEVWDLTTGRRKHILTGHGSPVDEVIVSRDGALAVSACSTGQDLSIRVWEPERGRCRHLIKAGTKPIAITRDGRYAFSQGTAMVTLRPLPHTIKSEDHTLRLWDLNSGRCLHTFRGHEQSIRAITLTPDEKSVLSVSLDRTMRRWDWRTGECLKVYKGHQFAVNSVAVTPNSRLAVTGSEDCTVRLWDLDSGRCLRTYEGHKKEVLHVFITPDGRFALSCSRDADLRLWGLEGVGILPASSALSRPKEVTQALQAASEVQREIDLAKTAIKSGRIVEAGTALRRALSEPGYERHAELLDLWHQAGCLGGQGVGLLFAHTVRTFKGFTATFWTTNPITLLPDGHRAVTAGDHDRLDIWDLESGRLLHSLTGHAEGYGVQAFAATPDGRLGVSGGADFTVRIWDLLNGRCLHVFSTPNKRVTAVAVTPDGRYALSGGWDGRLVVWDIIRGGRLCELEGHKFIVRSITLAPDGRQAVSGSNDGTLRLWDLTNWECVRTFDYHQGVIAGVALTSDGRFAISAGGGDKTLALWELASGKCRRIFEGHEKAVTGVEVTPDGRQAVSASADGTLRQWELSSGQCIHIFEGHADDVNWVTLSRDGRFAASASKDWSIRIWDLQSGNFVRSLMGHEAEVHALVFTPDGRHILSGGGNHLRLWQTDWDFQFPEPADWDEGARPYLEIFLTLHTPHGPDGISRVGAPTWTEEEFQQLLTELGYRGYGWLRPEGVQRKLEELAALRC